jgi:glycerol-3-phosphate acyltransferase PlsX
MSLRIAIDCMGGDHGLSVTIPAAVAFARSEPAVSLLLVGDEQAIRGRLDAIAGAPLARLEVRHAPEVVSMDEPPASALRGKRRSSMRLAVEAVRDGEAHACVSAGNTGALMAISRFVLKMLEGIDRPAIAAPMPNARGGVTTVLDLGANVDCEPQHFLQFAIMGAALATAVEGKSVPTVGLLNIGEEVIKGNDAVRQAAELLRASSLAFRGNVALKTSEGLARMIGGFIREEYGRGLLSRLAGLISLPVLGRLKRRLDHRRYNGASLIGLRGIVIKSHGSADALAFEYALRRAHDAARNGLLERIAEAVARISAEALKVDS